MRKSIYSSIRSCVLHAEILFAVTGLAAWGQQAQSPAKQKQSSLEVAVLYVPVYGNLIGGGDFWAQGGGVQTEGRFYRGLGAVADISGWHTGSMRPDGAGLSLVTATFGPRYTWAPARQRIAVFGHALAGVANGFDSVFPGPNGAEDSANSVALQLGGGANYTATRRVSIRIIEADWLRTQLPNATNNTQNSLRLGAGIVFRISK